MRRRLRRGATPAASVEASDVDDQRLVDLLHSVRDVRTALTLELSAAAGALEDERPEVARDIVAAASDEVAAIGARSRRDQVRPTTPRPRSAPRKALLALPVIPLVGAIAMSAAAAIGGHNTNPAHQRRPATSVTATSAGPAQVAVHLPHPASAHRSATTTLRRLEHVVTHDPRASQVLAVAADLHQQLTAMIATATDDPARLHVVQQLLTLEQRVLEASKVPGTRLALQASREIARLLGIKPSQREAAPASSSTATGNASTSPSMPHATRTPSSIPPKRPSTPTTSSTSKSTTTTHPKSIFGGSIFG
ncbi:MAG TPA: hypothetical protein VHB18_07920 [Mycobacteriales bacterium]|nr:hypothetical protein [Mycobacteriales bacterium]